MAIQKHNIYYDASKPESGIYYYAENGEQKELFLNNVLLGENGISAISAVDGNTWVIGITDDYKDNIEKIPGLSDNFVILSADVGNKLYVSATDNWDVLPYSGSTNISIHDHIIDFQNTANLIGDDTHIAVISADNNIIVSALKDFVDEEYVDEAIASSVSGKFDSSAFNTYSGNINSTIEDLNTNKLDITATNDWDITPYSAGNGVNISGHTISVLKSKPLTGDDKNIEIVETDDFIIVSGLKDFVDKEYVDDAIASVAPTSAVANKLDKAVFSAYSADIALQLNNISADKLDTSAFTVYSAHALDDYYKKSDTSGKQEIQNALNEKQDNLTNEQLSAISSVSAIQSISANWLTEEDIKDFITEDEVESVSSTLTAQTNYLSGIIDAKLDTSTFTAYSAHALDNYYDKQETKGLINDLSGTVSSQLNNKLDTSIFTTYSGNINNQINTVSSEVDKKLYTSATNDWDVTPYSGINGIKVENHLISVSANYALSADVYSKSQIDDIIANFGGFQIVNEDAQGKPDVSDPSTKIIYLTLVDDDPAAFDKYREWIWTNSEWECIGIASIDLKDYAKTQDVITSAVATSAWINNTFYNKTETSGKTEIQNALDTKLDTTAFNDYSDNIDDLLQALSSVKLDTSAFTAYSTDIESQLDTLSAIKLDKTYSATVNEQLTAKLDTSAFTTYSAEINTELNNITVDVDKKLYTSATDNWDYIAYSGGQNVSVVDHIIDISGTKSLSGDGKNIEVVELADTFIISATKDIVDKSYVDNNFVSKTDFGTYSGNTKNQIDSKLNKSDFDNYSATVLNDYYKKSETSGKTEIQDALDTKLNTSVFTVYSADVKTQIDSKLNKTDFDDYSARALDDYYTKNETDAEITDAINDISATVSTDYLKKADVQEYTAGNNIDITNYVISGRDWTPELNTKVNNIDFTAYSADVKTQIDSKLNKSDFDNYSATALNNYYTKDETSGKQEIQDALDEKQNNLSNEQLSAISSVSAIQAISGDWATKTEVENTSAILTAQTNYLSGIVDNKLDTTAFDTYTAAALVDYYTKSETNTLVDNSIADISATVSTDYLKKADVREYTAGDNIDITNYVISGKDWTPELNTKVNNTDFNTYSASTKTQIDSKLNKDDFNTYSAHADTTPYSGINGIKVENHLISVSANYALSADVYSKSEVDNIRDAIAKELAGLGFYDCKSDEIKANGEPDETVLETRELLSNNKIYLVKDNTAPVPDQYKEWIWDGTNWTCIGDTSISLVAYAKTQDVIASAIATSAWINDTFYDKTETSGKQQIQDALDTKLNTSIFTAYSASTKTQIDSKLNKSDFDDYSAHALDDYYKKSETSGKTEIQTALGTKLDTTVFNDYTATALNNYYTKDETSGKNEIQNALNTKLDTTAFNDYTATALNDIATNSGNWNASYTALTANSGNWNNTYNTVTTNSGKWENSYTALTANSALWLKEADVAGFATKTELNNASSILINQDNYLSGVIDTKLDTTAFNAYSAHALDEYYKKSETSGKTEIQNALGTKLDTTAFNNYSANVKTQIDSKLTKNDFDSYSAAVDNDIDYISAAVSSIPAQVQSDWEETNTASPAYIQNKPVDLEMSAGNGISITETNNTLVFAVSGNYADATEVNNKLTALSANKLDISATTGWDISAYSAGNNITIVDHVIDLKESKNLIGDGENIIVTESGSNIIVSALKDILDKDDFDSYSAIIDDDIDYLSAAIEDSILSVGTDLKIENNIISVNTNGTANSAYMAFVEGSATLASGIYSHAEGVKTFTSGGCNHAEGYGSSAISWEAHAEGNYTLASGVNSHAEGNCTTAAGVNSHAEGYKTFAGYQAHAEGDRTSAMGNHTHAEGQLTIANNNCAHAEGQQTSALAMQTHAEGGWTLANNNCAHAEGFYTKALGYASHTEGQFTNAATAFAHAEGNGTSAIGIASHAEGAWTVANHDYSHAEGQNTSALGAISHAEGSGTMTMGAFAHAEGNNTSALLTFSHAEGQNTIANSYAMHAGGMYNKTSADALFVIGNGTAETARSDAFIITSAGLASATILATSGIPDIEAAITSIPAQVQSDWEETNIASPAYIQNKPVDLEMSAGNGISITETNNTLVFAVSGNYADTTEVDTHYGKKTNDVYYIKPDLPYDLYSSTATYAVGDKVVWTAGSGSLYSAKSAVTTPGAWSANSGKFAGVSNVVFTAENEDITELYDGLKIALYLPSRLAATDSYLNINGLGDVPLFRNNYNKLTSAYFPTSGVVIDFTYISATNRWVWADYDSNSTYAGMVDACVNLSASATNISAACTNFSARPGSMINVTFPRDYTAVSAKKFRAGTTTYQPLYLNGSATSNTNYFIPSGTWPVYYDGNNWYLWTDGSIQFSAIRGTVIDCVKYNDIQYAIGSANTATGSTTARYSVALGNSNSAYNSFVIGNYNKGNESYIFGEDCTGTHSYLFGTELSGKSWLVDLGDIGEIFSPVIVGKNNATTTSAYFVVGAGTAFGDSKADAFIVSSNKVASAADFKAGNGVSLSSLTGLATSSWVNGQIADAITSIPAQVQSDWSATNTASPAYIQNKPDVLIPVDSPAALGGISKPTNIMVVSAMPASPDSATIYLVQGTMIGN